MFCSECGAVLAPGPIDARRAGRGETIDRRPALLRRLWRWVAAHRFVPKPSERGPRHDPRI